MAKWSGFYKFVQPAPATTQMTDSQEMADTGAYNNYTWYQRLVQGSASRLTRYREYELMDNDVEVSRALDTIAEEITGNALKNTQSLIVDVLTREEGDNISRAVMTVKTALNRWVKIHELDTRIFKMARIMVKYGDIFFRRRKLHEKWEFIHPKNVVAAIVDQDDATKVIAWQIRVDTKKVNQVSFSSSLGTSESSKWETEIVSAKEIIRMAINDDMADTQPFGESILRPVYRAHKQKELLEDAIIIYRIQRAPERRVFKIDVGKMPPHRAKQYLEQVKNEIRQKRVPTMNGGVYEVDSVYNPQSMSEDFFFASRPDGRGSSVEQLQGGQGLGELADLEYFQRKVWRGLRVPTSYMQEGQETNGALFNDGRVGVAYIQELRFALFIMRLQRYMEMAIDAEFKRYLKQNNIFIDESMYEIVLPEPSNFGKYRQQEVDNSLLSTFTTADGVQYLSKRFILSKYLQMSDEEIVTNERMKREELGLDPDGGKEDYATLYSAPGGETLGGGMMGGGLGTAPGLGGMGAGMGPEMMPSAAPEMPAAPPAEAEGEAAPL